MRVQTWLVAAPPTVAPEFVEEGAIRPAEEGGGGGGGKKPVGFFEVRGGGF